MMSPLIECIGIGKKFGRIWVFRGLSHKFHEGKAVAILGPSGSGKTTLLKILGLISRPSEGILRFKGINVYNERDNLHLLRRSVGYSFQEPIFINKISVLDNLLLPILPYTKRSDLIHYKRRAIEILDNMGLVKYLNYKPAKLSTGEKKRIDLARALVKDPEVLIVDEPTANLDEVSANIIREILINTKNDGKLVIYALHKDKKLIRMADEKIQILNYKKTRIAPSNSRGN